jgi:DNA-binding response OmpR family regulator
VVADEPRRLVVQIVEDHTAIADVLAESFRYAGLDARAVTDGFDRLAGPDAAEYWVGVDAAVVDLWLGPDFHGDRILEWLAVNRPDIRRIVLTASGFITGRTRGLADVILDKPTSPARIVAAIRGEWDA